VFSAWLSFTAFLLGYVAFRGMCGLCGNDDDLIPLSDAAGAQHSPEGGVLHMAELREMLKEYLKEERIENTVRSAAAYHSETALLQAQQQSSDLTKH